MADDKVSSAAQLLMKDLSAAKQHPSMALQAAQPQAQLPILNAIERFNLQPVADVIICELRFCRGCGHAKAHTSSRVFRLFSSCVGQPYKKVLRLRKPDELPLELRCVRVVEVPSDHCQECWHDNLHWHDAVLITPEKPAFIPGQVVIGKDPDLVKALAKKSKSKYADFIAKSPYEQAKEL